MAGKITNAGGKLAIVVAAAILGGCNANDGASGEAMYNFLIGEFANIEPVELQVGGETYRVFDKPSATKMIITRSMGWILINGASGWTPKEPYGAAAAQHLANTGRSSCRVTEVSVIMGPKHGIKYDCTPPAAPAAAAKLKR
jgi:hypothetical protein